MKRIIQPSKGVGASRVRGFSLVELMIALLLGLIVIGSAGSIYLANKRAYPATEVLGRVQESSRVAF